MQSVMAILQSWVLPLTLWTIMFGIGLTLRPTDFRQILVNRKGFVLGSASMIVCVPVLGIVLALLTAPSPALLMGFVLLATTPGGILSNVLTDLAGGDVALSVSLSIFVSIVYIFTLPFIVQAALAAIFGHAAAVAIPFSSSFAHIVAVTLLPASAGVIVRARLPMLAVRVSPALRQVSTTVLVILLVLIFIQQLDTLRHAFGRLMLIVVAMNALNLGWATGLCRMVRLRRSESVAVINEHLIRQEGTAIYVAVSLLGRQDVSLPMIVNSFVGILIGMLFVAILRRTRTVGGNENAIERI